MQIENFSIRNLFGYLNFNININDNTLILVAENGAGKTNILRLMSLFLSKQWSKLIEYEFESVSAIINGKHYKFVKSDFKTTSIPLKVIEDAIVEFPIYEVFIRQELPKYQIQNLLSDDLLISEIENDNDVPIGLINSILQRLSIIEFNGDQFDWTVNVLYLPTYRRIERSFGSLYSDLDKRLSQYIRQTIVGVNLQIEDEKKRSEAGFSETENDLLRIFETLWNARDFERWDDSQGNIVMELIEFGMDDVQYRLNTVLAGAIETSQIIEKYISICNKYLSNGKKLVLTKSRKYIEIRSKSDEPILMASLSSGEKQILSLFSYLVLNPRKIFVIIDEPELSLSISWQEMLLGDLKDFGISGIVAATHSPFIVSPALKPFTHGLNEFDI